MSPQHILTTEMQRGIKRGVSRPNLVQNIAGVGLLGLLATFGLTPILPAFSGVTATVATEAVTGVLAGFGGNAIADWLNKTGQEWAGVKDPTVEQLANLSQHLVNDMAANRALRQEVIKLLQVVDAFNIAANALDTSIYALSTQQQRYFSTLSYKLAQLQQTVERLDQYSREQWSTQRVAKIFETYSNQRINAPASMPIVWSVPVLEQDTSVSSTGTRQISDPPPVSELASRRNKQSRRIGTSS